jgi:hypothetical protein
METKDQDLIIKVLIAIPRSKNFYNFYINSTNEKRSMKLEALADFVTKLCPAIGGKARAMIYEFRPFYAEIETETLLELEETPGAPESHRQLLFGRRISTPKMAEKTRKKPGGFVSGHKQGIFNNILKLVKKEEKPSKFGIKKT